MDLSALSDWWAKTPTTEILWIGIGLFAQCLFSMRFLVQWVATERARASIIPETFWYFSFAGGVMLLAYAIYRLDPVFIIGQGTGLIIYARNIYFIWLGKRAAAPAPTPPAAPPPGRSKKKARANLQPRGAAR